MQKIKLFQFLMGKSGAERFCAIPPLFEGEVPMKCPLRSDIIEDVGFSVNF